MLTQINLYKLNEIDIGTKAEKGPCCWVLRSGGVSASRGQLRLKQSRCRPVVKAPEPGALPASSQRSALGFPLCEAGASAAPASEVLLLIRGQCLDPGPAHRRRFIKAGSYHGHRPHLFSLDTIKTGSWPTKKETPGQSTQQVGGDASCLHGPLHLQACLFTRSYVRGTQQSWQTGSCLLLSLLRG